MSELRRHIMMQQGGGEYDTNKYLQTLSAINPNFNLFNLGNIDLSQIRIRSKVSFTGNTSRQYGDYAYQIAYTSSYGSFKVNLTAGTLRMTTGGAQNAEISISYTLGQLMEIETTYGKLVLNGTTYTQSLSPAQIIPIELYLLQYGICKFYFVEVYNGSTLVLRLHADEQNGQKGLVDDVSGTFEAAVNQNNVIIGDDA